MWYRPHCAVVYHQTSFADRRPMSAAHSRDTYLAAKYRRIAARRGPVKAIVAVEQTMLIAIWNMLTTGALYDDLGGDFYTRRNPDKDKNRAVDQLRKWATPSPSTPSPKPDNNESWHKRPERH